MKTAKETHEEYWKSSSATEKKVKERGPVSRHLQEILLSLTSNLRFSSVIDAGCGHGTVLNILHSKYPKTKCIGMDISEVAISEAKKKYPKIEFLRHDFSVSPPSKKADLIICLDVIEHIEDDEKALKNLAKMTNKYLIISTVKGRMRAGEREAGHVRNYRYDELVRKVEESGLKIKKIIKWGFPFYSPLYRNTFEVLVKIRRKPETRKKVVVNVAEIPFIMILAEPLYWLMKLNVPGKGDHLFILAETKK